MQRRWCGRRAGVGLVATASVLGGCGLSEAGSDEPAPQVELAFAYQPVGGEGFVDQTLTITNTGALAGAPDLDLVPLDDRGAEVADVTVVTAYGSDEGAQVVPAYTEVIEIVKFKGPGASEVVDLRVEVVDPGPLQDDVPPANDLRVQRFDISGKQTDGGSTLGAVSLRNTYDAPITVTIVGIEYAEARDGETQHFRQVSELAGPLVIEPGERAKARVAAKYRSRFFGSVKAYLSR